MLAQSAPFLETIIADEVALFLYPFLPLIARRCFILALVIMLKMLQQQRLEAACRAHERGERGRHAAPMD